MRSPELHPTTRLANKDGQRGYLKLVPSLSLFCYADELTGLNSWKCYHMAKPFQWIFALSEIPLWLSW